MRKEPPQRHRDTETQTGTGDEKSRVKGFLYVSLLASYFLKLCVAVSLWLNIWEVMYEEI